MSLNLTCGVRIYHMYCVSSQFHINEEQWEPSHESPSREGESNITKKLMSFQLSYYSTLFLTSGTIGVIRYYYKIDIFDKLTSPSADSLMNN